MAEDILKTIELHSKGYGLIPKLIMQDTSLHITSKAIYAYFCSYAGSGDICFPSRNKICADLGISTDTFGKYLRQLTEKGYIECTQIKENGKFSHNVYTLCSTISPCPKISDTENTVHGDLDTNINSTLNNNSYSNNNNISVSKKESKPKNEYENIINGYTDNGELREALWEFIKMRKLNKKPMTDRALKGIMNKLDTLASTDTEKIAILDQSITNSWQGVFPLKQNNGGNNNGFDSNGKNLAEVEAAFRECEFII
jgi:hypothetical protein